MRAILVAVALAAMFCAAPAAAAPPCEPADNAELCALAADTLADNPSFAVLGTETQADAAVRAARHAGRRERARAVLDAVAAPTWRDLYRAGYVIAYGDTREERMLALAIAIRALSLAPDEADVRFLVAMTVDAVGRNYVGRQVYGRQKYFQLAPGRAVQRACLPQMLLLPASVGTAFHAVDGYEACPPGVGEIYPRPDARR